MEHEGLRRFLVDGLGLTRDVLSIEHHLTLGEVDSRATVVLHNDAVLRGFHIKAVRELSLRLVGCAGR